MSFHVPKPKFDLPPPNVDRRDPSDFVSMMPTYRLNSGYDMPAIGYGTFRSDANDVGKGVLDAIKAGYRHFDCARLYLNEVEIGHALKEAFDTGLVKREDLFITSKLWNSDHDVDVVPKALEFTLKSLQLDYLDLYLIHFPVAWKHDSVENPSWGKSELGDTPLIDTYRAMEKLVDEGKIRSIGVSNYPLVLMHDLVTQARIAPACHQIEVHPYYVRDSLVNYCLSRDICVTAHTPLGGGPTANKEGFQAESPFDSDEIKALAEAKGATPAQIMLRWHLQRGLLPLPKSVRENRIKENIDVFFFNLSEEEMKLIASLDLYRTYKTNKNPFVAFAGGPDCFSEGGTDIFD